MIKFLPDLLFFHCKKGYYHHAQVDFISDKSILFDGCPTAKLAKK